MTTSPSSQPLPLRQPKRERQRETDRERKRTTQIEEREVGERVRLKTGRREAHLAQAEPRILLSDVRLSGV
jgi:hypothetical protein